MHASRLRSTQSAYYYKVVGRNRYRQYEETPVGPPWYPAAGRNVSSLPRQSSLFPPLLTPPTKEDGRTMSEGDSDLCPGQWEHEAVEG